MAYFLAKSEPDVYSIDDLEHDKRTVWDGVKNPQAVNAIREMKSGDRVFIYHSGGVSSVVGIANVKSDARDDPKNPKSQACRQCSELILLRNSIDTARKISANSKAMKGV